MVVPTTYVVSSQKTKELKEKRDLKYKEMKASNDSWLKENTRYNLILVEASNVESEIANLSIKLDKAEKAAKAALKKADALFAKKEATSDEFYSLDAAWQKAFDKDATSPASVALTRKMQKAAEKKKRDDIKTRR